MTMGFEKRFGALCKSDSGVLAGGLAWSWLYAKYESIWPSWLSHVIVDAAIMTVGWFLLF